MKKLVLVVEDGCPNCEYILSHLEKLGLMDYVEVVDRSKANVRAVPAVIYDGEVDYVTGNVYGLIKILSYIKKLGGWSS
ncbi:MAG: hypothetical protein QXW41_08060 [Fervidicoccaceae archaeon]